MNYDQQATMGLIGMVCLLAAAYYFWVLIVKFQAPERMAEKRRSSDHYDTVFSIAAEYLGEFRAKVLPTCTPKWIVHTFDILTILVSPPFVLLAFFLGLAAGILECTGITELLYD